MPAAHAGRLLGASWFLERYVLSLVYLFFAWRELHELVIYAVDPFRLMGFWGIDLPPAVGHLLLFLLQLFIGIFLLTSRRPSGQPRNLREVFVPLAAAFFFLAYNALPFFPPSLGENLLPREMRTACMGAALVLGVIGPAISTWGVMHLRRSFGIFVSVREVVTGGPYRHVRHPIYLGYICIWSGFVLAYGSVAILLIVSIHFALFVWRARLEEARLAESSAAYREYMKQTGFLFPKITSGFGS